MAHLHRFLSVTNSTNSTAAVLQDSAPELQSVPGKSDFVFVLAALLCAVICIVGLISVLLCMCCRANKGLNKKTLQSLPVTTYDISNEGLEAECAICLAEYVSGEEEEIRVLPQCGHGFHVRCIDMWLRSHLSCPTCREVLAVGWGGDKVN